MVAAPSKNNIPGLNIKKEFVDRQLAIISYVEEAERLSLSDILRDPIVVHSLEDYSEAYQEQEKLRLIKSTMKSLQKIKRKNIDLTPFLNSPKSPNFHPMPRERESFIEAVMSLNTDRVIFDLLPNEESISYTKERGVEDFKAHLKWVGDLPRFTIQQPTFARNMPASSSHSQLLKKLERQDVTVSKEPSPMQARPVNEITTTTMFKNGVMRPAPAISQRTSPIIPRAPGIPAMKGTPPGMMGEGFGMLKRPHFTIANRSEEPEISKRQRTKDFETEQSKNQFNGGDKSNNNREQ